MDPHIIPINLDQMMMDYNTQSLPYGSVSEKVSYTFSNFYNSFISPYLFVIIFLILIIVFIYWLAKSKRVKRSTPKPKPRRQSSQQRQQQQQSEQFNDNINEEQYKQWQQQKQKMEEQQYYDDIEQRYHERLKQKSDNDEIEGPSGERNMFDELAGDNYPSELPAYASGNAFQSLNPYDTTIGMPLGQ